MRGNKGFFSKKVLNLSRKFVILSLLQKGEKSINSRRFAVKFVDCHDLHLQVSQ